MRSYRPCHRRLWDRAGRAGPSLPRHLGNVDHVRTAVLRAEKPSAGCAEPVPRAAEPRGREAPKLARIDRAAVRPYGGAADGCLRPRSEEHTSELQSLMRTSYAGFCLN